jgi:hypothetical protein
MLSQNGAEIVDAEVVEEPAASAAGSKTFNEPLSQPDGPTKRPEDNGSETFNESPKEPPVDVIPDERPALPKEEK